jgi:RNA polymerase sigma-70 factor (ECF subfamily)
VRLLDASADARSLRTTELYLTCACARNDVRAILLFEQGYLREVEHALKRFPLDAGARADLLGSLREKLLFQNEGRAPEILGYSGRGELRSWLRSVAVRAALKLVGARRRERTLEEAVFARVSSEADPEIAALKKELAPLLTEALRTSIANLTVRERNLLRRHYVDRLNLDALAKLEGVHRATVARRLATVRASLLDAAKEALRRHLVVTESDFKSILRLVQSQLELSLGSGDMFG